MYKCAWACVTHLKDISQNGYDPEDVKEKGDYVERLLLSRTPTPSLPHKVSKTLRCLHLLDRSSELLPYSCLANFDHVHVDTLEVLQLHHLDKSLVGYREEEIIEALLQLWWDCTSSAKPSPRSITATCSLASMVVFQFSLVYRAVFPNNMVL